MIARVTSARTTAHTLPSALTSALSMSRDEVLATLTARERSLDVVPVQQVRFIDVGPRDRRVQIGDRAVAPSSFAAVCDLLEVPAGWMHRAPLDLANSVAERMLGEERVHESDLVMDERCAAVIGSVPHGQRLTSSLEVVERLLSSMPDIDALMLREEADRIDLSVVTRALAVEPRPGDVVRGGLSCLYSEVDRRVPRLRAFSERLVCTNGMTHRDFERMFGLTDDFMEALPSIAADALAYVQSTLGPRLERAVTFDVNGAQAIRRIFADAHLPARLMNAVLAAHAAEDDGTAYGVLQAFTRAARDARRDRDRERLQLVAGDELRAIDKSHCSQCYAAL